MNEFPLISTSAVIGMVMVAVIIIGPLEWVRRKINKKWVNFLLLPIEAVWLLVVLAGTPDAVTKEHTYWQNNQPEIVEQITKFIDEGKIKEATTLVNKYKGYGNAEIDRLSLVVAQKKHEADEKRLVELDKLIKGTEFDAVKLGFYKERYEITRSDEDKNQVSKYQAIIDKVRAENARVAEEEHKALSMALYLTQMTIEKSLKVPGSYKELRAAKAFTRDGKNIMAAIEYTAKNPFGVDVRTMSGGLFTKDGSKPIRNLTKKEMQSMF